MKFLKKCGMILMVLACIMSISSCTDEKDVIGTVGEELGTKVFINGEEVVYRSNTRASEPDMNQWKNVPLEIGQTERDSVVKAIIDGRYKIVESLGWMEFYVQQLYKGTDCYTAKNGDYFCGSDRMDYLIFNGDHVFNFNYGNGTLMLMKNSLVDNFAYHGSIDDKVHTEAVLVAIPNYGYYVAYDFCGSGQYPNMQCDRDNVYTDWIVKVVRAEGGNAIMEYPDDGNADDGDDNDDNIGGDDNDDEQPTDSIGDEIEYDIHLQQHKDWNEIKTTVHVRACTAVTVTIPISKDLVAEADDFAIRTYSKWLPIEDKDIAVNIQIQHTDDAVIITIPSLTQKQLDAVRKDNFNDGITFEVHTYVLGISDNEIWKKLKKSTVKCAISETKLRGQITRYTEDTENQ